MLRDNTLCSLRRVQLKSVEIGNTYAFLYPLHIWHRCQFDVTFRKKKQRLIDLSSFLLVPFAFLHHFFIVYVISIRCSLFRFRIFHCIHNYHFYGLRDMVASSSGQFSINCNTLHSSPLHSVFNINLELLTRCNLVGQQCYDILNNLGKAIHQWKTCKLYTT